MCARLILYFILSLFLNSRFFSLISLEKKNRAEQGSLRNYDLSKDLQKVRE